MLNVKTHKERSLPLSGADGRVKLHVAHGIVALLSRPVISVVLIGAHKQIGAAAPAFIGDLVPSAVATVAKIVA